MRAKASMVCTFLFIAAISVGATTYKTLHNFSVGQGDGDSPYAGLTLDLAGNLYGVAAYGSADYSDGVVFRMSPSPGGWNYQILHKFDFYEPLGRDPKGGLAIDEAGNIYGTNSFVDDDYECGTVFTSAGWVPIYTFTGPDGCIPQSNLRYSNGWVIGTTSGGGVYGQGTLFFLTTSGSTIYTYSFKGTEGTNPSGGFNIFGYGITLSGGRKGQGNVYRLGPDGLIGKNIFKLDGQAGYAPMGDLLTAYVGDVRTMYGTTYAGGKHGGGTVYRLTENQLKTENWRMTTLHSFSGPDGSSPMAGLTADAAGNLYGTTSYGGDFGCGTVFKLSPKANNRWKFTVLYSFNPDNQDSGGDGCHPTSGVVVDAAGNLYGTTLSGGWYQRGTVYEIIP